MPERVAPASAQNRRRLGNDIPFIGFSGLAAVLIAPSLAGAQTIDNKLKDVKRLALTFEPFDADSANAASTRDA